MDTQLSPFAAALRADMADLSINPRMLGQRLGITQQAVDKWVRRGFPPPNRINDLVAALGRDSHVARLTTEEMFGSPKAPAPQERRPNVATAPAPGASVDVLRRAQETAEREFVEALPRELRMNTMHGRGGSCGGPPGIRLDYCSNKLLLDVRVRLAGAGRPTAAPAALRLLAAHQQFSRTAPGATPRRMVLAVVTPLPEDEARAGESLALAGQLGIEVWVCRSGAELAERVCDAEGYDSELALEDELA